MARDGTGTLAEDTLPLTTHATPFENQVKTELASVQSIAQHLQLVYSKNEAELVSAQNTQNEAEDSLSIDLRRARSSDRSYPSTDARAVATHPHAMLIFRGPLNILGQRLVDPETSVPVSSIPFYKISL